MADLEATLAITINRDDVDSAMAGIKADIEKGVQATFAKAAQMFGATLGRLGLGGGAGGGGAASTGTPGHAGGPSGGATSTGAPSGGGGGRSGGPPPAASTGGSGGGQSSSSRRRRGGSTGSLWTDEEMADHRRWSREREQRGGSGYVTTAGDVRSAMQRGTSDPIGSLQDAMVLKGMNIGGFAGRALGGAAAGIGMAVEGLGDNKDASNRFAGRVRPMALAALSGSLTSDPRSGGVGPDGRPYVDPTHYWRDAHTRYGLSVAESSSNLEQYRQAVGFRETNALDFNKFADAGISTQAAGQFRSLKQFGFADGSTDPTELAKVAQAQGLQGPGVDRYLQSIQGHLAKLASRGVMLDPAAMTMFMHGMLATPGLENVGQRGVTAAESLSTMGMSLGDQVKAYYKQIGQLAVDRDVLREASRSGGDGLALMQASNKFSDPNRVAGSMQSAGRGMSDRQRTAMMYAAAEGYTIDEAEKASRPGAILGRNSWLGSLLGAGDVDIQRLGDGPNTRNNALDWLRSDPGEVKSMEYLVTNPTMTKSQNDLSWAADNWKGMGTGAAAGALDQTVKFFSGQATSDEMLEALKEQTEVQRLTQETLRIMHEALLEAMRNQTPATLR